MALWEKDSDFGNPADAAETRRMPSGKKRGKSPIVVIRMTEAQHEAVSSMLDEWINMTQGEGWESDAWDLLVCASRKISSAKPTRPRAKGHPRSAGPGLRGLR